jgi:predicted PurR-regulated permease PerM
MVNEQMFKRFIVGSLIAILLIAAFIIIWPIFLSIITGMILAYICFPVYKIVLKVVREKNIASFIILLMIIFILFLPIWFLAPLVTRQAFDAYTYFQKTDISGIIGKILPASISVDTLSMINSFVSKSANAIFSKVSDSILNISDIILQALVILIVFFFSMRDWVKLKDYVKQLSPFSSTFEKSLEKQFKDITNSVIFGHIIIGVLQGLFTGLGLWIAGVQQPLLLTIVAIFAAILPVVGAWLVWIPAAIYLFSIGHTTAALGLFLYGAIFISWIDNVLRLFIISRRTSVSSAIIFIGMFGGLLTFGVMGLILGPLVLAYLIVLLDAYKDKKLTEFFTSD